MVEEKLGRSLQRYEGTAFKKEDTHIGVQAQKQDGYYYVNIPMLGGRMSSKDMILFADLSDKFGNGELRLTPKQNIIMANVKDKAYLLRILEEKGFPFKGSSLKRNSVGCASDFCGKTVTVHCKVILRETVNHLESCISTKDHWRGQGSEST